MGKSFNNTNFSALLAWHVQNSNMSIESVLNVLTQSSDNSRLGKLNHNCRISGIPFTWDYRSGDKQIRVLTFPMSKISTGWDFYLDIEESGYIYLSEGINTRRTYCKASILNSFSPSTMHQIADVIDLLCGADMDKEKIFFDIYRRFGGRGIEIYNRYDSECKSLDTAYTFDHDYVYVEYMQNFESACEHEEIRKSNMLKKIAVVRWDSEDDCWYVDFILDNSAYHIDCLINASTYEVKKDLTFDEEDDIPIYAKAWLIKAIKSVPYGDWKNGSYFCYESDNGEWKSTRLWSKIPEDKRVNLFISTEDRRYFYNDIREIDLSPEDNPTSDIAMHFGNGRVLFVYSHESCESEMAYLLNLPDDDKAEID